MHRIIFQIGPFTLYSYGLCVAVGFIVSTALVLRDSRLFGMKKEDLFDCMIAILAGGLIGGRLLFVMVNWGYYWRQPLRIFMLNEGGMAFQGALAVAALAGVLVARVKKLPFWKTSDLIAPYLALGQAIGRIGCFLNGCCYGKITEGGISIIFPGESVARIPVQVYATLSLFALFGVLLFLRAHRRFDGYVFTMYITLYGALRFFMDFLRGDNPAYLFGLQLSQLISAGIFFLGIVMWVVLARRGNSGKL